LGGGGRVRHPLDTCEHGITRGNACRACDIASLTAQLQQAREALKRCEEERDELLTLTNRNAAAYGRVSELEKSLATRDSVAAKAIQSAEARLSQVEGERERWKQLAGRLAYGHTIIAGTNRGDGDDFDLTDAENVAENMAREFESFLSHQGGTE
jgi:hypothetical protein